MDNNEIETQNQQKIKCIYPHIFLNQEHQLNYQIACKSINFKQEATNKNKPQLNLQSNSQFSRNSKQFLNQDFCQLQQLQLNKLIKMQQKRSNALSLEPNLYQAQNQQQLFFIPFNEIQQESQSDDSFEQMTFCYNPKIQNSKQLRNNFDYQKTYDDLKIRYDTVVKKNQGDNQSKSEKSNILINNKNKSYDEKFQELQEYEIQSQITIQSYNQRIKQLNSINAEARIIRKQLKKFPKNNLIEKVNELIKNIVRQLCSYRNIITARESRLKKKNKHIQQIDKSNSIEILVYKMKSKYQDALKDKPEKLYLILSKIDEYKKELDFKEEQQIQLTKKYIDFKDRKCLQ